MTLDKSILPTATIREAFDRYGIRRYRKAFAAYVRTGKQSRGLRCIRQPFARLPMDDDPYTLCFLELVNIARENAVGPPPG
jgi:hypothetical protein